MATNDQIILKQIIQQRNDEMETKLTESDFFERFVSDQVLKNYDLSYDEIDSGIVDGGDDGGIDAIYLLINGDLINVDSDVSDFKRNIKIDLFLVQAKATNGFSHTSIGKFISSSKDLLNFSIPIPSLQKHYNGKLVSIIEKFRKVYRSLLMRHPELCLTYIYASYGDTKEIHHNLLWEKDKLRDAVTGLLDSYFEFHFVVLIAGVKSSLVPG